MLMNLRRALVLVAAALLALAPSACNWGEPRLSVAFISNNPHEFWTIARRGTEQAERDINARRNPGERALQVEFYMPAYGTAAEQHRIVEDLVAKGCGGIAISPNDAAHQSRVLNGIIPRQVAFITQDSDLPRTSRRLCYIGTDNVRAGWAVGQLVREALGDRGGKVMIYVGMLDVQNAQERRRGVIAALAGLSEDEAKTEKAVKIAEPNRIPNLSGKYEVLGTMTDEASQDKCKRNVEDTLSKYPDVNCLVGLWAYNPPAMLQAVRDARKLGRVQLVGFDEDEQTLQGIKDGHVYATVVQNPYEFGRLSVEILYHKITTGELLPKLPDYVLVNGKELYVRHRVIRRRDSVREGQLFDVDVEVFWQDLRKKKG
jgi:ribose transport system substrate-binding protein